MNINRALRQIIAEALLSCGVALAGLGMGAGTGQAAPGFVPLAHWCPGDPVRSCRPAGTRMSATTITGRDRMRRIRIRILSRGCRRRGRCAAPSRADCFLNAAGTSVAHRRRRVPQFHGQDNLVSQHGSSLSVGVGSVRQ
jgi:hypothetical protein